MLAGSKNTRHTEIRRFLAVGVATFLLNLCSVYFFLKALHLDYRIAVSLAYVITVMTHFTAHRVFTFRAAQQPLSHNAMKYALMLGINYCVTLVISTLVIGWWKMPGYVAVISYTACNAITSFLFMKHLVFKPAIQRSAAGQR